MISLWHERHRPIESDVLDTATCHDVVVGGGLSGVMTALLLARSGREVVVLEAREIGAGATGDTTAKVSLLQGMRYSTLLEHQSERVARAYVDANREGRDWLLRHCETRGLPVERRTAVTYAPPGDEGGRRARAELDAARRLGVEVRWQDELGVPFPNAGGVALDDQAQIDPLRVLADLVAAVREEGGRVVTGARVTDVAKTGPATVRCADGRVLHCENVVLATGSPILDRGLYFAKLTAERSYALAFDHPDPPELMLLSSVSPKRSVRDESDPSGARRLLVGGEGHPTGREGSERLRLERLRAWTAQHFPDATETHHWSAQDHSTHDGFPHVGRLPRGLGHIHVATGYDKWGLTNAVAAGLAISADILGGQLPWAQSLQRRITRPSGAAEMAKMNAGVASEVARSARSGGLCRPEARCTHMGAALAWNDAEKTWDCPLHGSRFAPSGEVLDGPATRPLRSQEPSE